MASPYQKPKPFSKNPPPPKVPRSKDVNDEMKRKRTGRYPNPQSPREVLIIKRLPRMPKEK